MGSSFASLRSVRGGIYISGNSNLNNYETLRGLRCHGGVQSSSGNLAPVPDWLQNLPRCDPEVAPTPPPPTVPGATRTTVTYTTATMTTTTLVGTKVVGNIIVSQLHSPAALCTGGTDSSPTNCTVITAEEEAAISEITGTVSISHTQDGTLIGRFTQLKVIGGSLRITQNGALRSFGDAFAALQIVRGGFYIASCSALRSFDTSFASLRTVGFAMTMQSIGQSSEGSEITGINLFPSLETVGGQFYMSSAYFSSFVDAFRGLRTVGGAFYLQSLSRLEAISGASFRQLETIDQQFYMHNLGRLRTIEGQAFSSLRAVRHQYRSSSSRFSGQAFQMTSMSELRTITGSAFGSLEAVYGDMSMIAMSKLGGLGSFLALTEVSGQLSMYGLSPTFNRETALPALNCLGSVNYQTSSAIQVPPYVVDLTACTATYSPTPPGYTRTTATRTTATRTTTTLLGTKAFGHIIISQVHSPAALCTGGTYSSPTNCTELDADAEAVLTEVTGSIVVSYSDLTTLDGRFVNMISVGGHVYVQQNSALTSLGDAFSSLRSIGGQVNIQSCSALRSFNTAFESLHTIGDRLYIQSIGENNADGEIVGINLFQSLETVGGQFYINSAYFSSFVNAFRSLRTVGGAFQLQYLYRLQAISGASFQQLETVGQQFYMIGMDRLRIIEGPAFSSLRAVRYQYRSSSSRFSGTAFYMNSMSQLRAITGSAFGALEAVYGNMQVFSMPRLGGLGSFLALTEVTGQLSMYSLSPTFNRDAALTSLECVGSINYQTSAAVQVPARVSALPACPSTHAPTPPGYTRTTQTRTSTTATSTTLPGYNAVGNIIVSQLHAPSAVCTGGTYSAPSNCTALSLEEEAQITEVSGTVSVSHTRLTTLAGRFSALKVIGGGFRVTSNSLLREIGDGFAALQAVGGDFLMSNIGTNSQRVSGVDLFPSLRAVGGSFKMEWNYFSSFENAFHSLRTVGDEFYIYYDRGITAISGSSWQALTTVGLWFRINQANQLRTINGPAFSSLRHVYNNSRTASARTSREAFTFDGNYHLRGFTGNAFSALEVVFGKFQVTGCSRLLSLATFTSLTNIT